MQARRRMAACARPLPPLLTAFQPDSATLMRLEPLCGEHAARDTFAGAFVLSSLYDCVGTLPQRDVAAHTPSSDWQSNVQLSAGMPISAGALPAANAAVMLPSDSTPAPAQQRGHSTSSSATTSSSSSASGAASASALRHAADLPGLQQMVRNVQPVYGPCVMRPQPWTAPDYGAYLTCSKRANRGHTQGCSAKLVRTKSQEQEEPLHAAQALKREFDAHAEQRAALAAQLASGAGEDLDGGEALQPAEEASSASGADATEPQGLERVYEALNILGGQAWEINSDVLQVRDGKPACTCAPHCGSASAALLDTALVQMLDEQVDE